MAGGKNRYTQIIEAVFSRHHQEGATEVPFERADIIQAAEDLDLEPPKNVGDVVYSFRYRVDLPDSIARQAPEGYDWVIRPAGRSRYKFVLVTESTITPSRVLAETKIPDATPGVIRK